MRNFIKNCALLPLLGLLAAPLAAQDVAPPLTLQGLSRLSVPGARATGMGGSSAATAGDAMALFSNAALLSFLPGAEVRLGGRYARTEFSQNQEWLPNELFAEFSLLFEQNPATVVKPFDDLPADWDYATSALRPASGALSVPVEVGGVGLTGAVGFTEWANLDYFHQNNNALSPNIGQMRPAPIPRPKTNDTLYVQWYQHNVQRTGSVYAAAPALALQIGDDLSLGVSVSILFGSSDDAEFRGDRGLLKLTTQPNSTSSWNNFQLVEASFTQSSSGTSEYSGWIPALGVAFRQQAFAIGINAQLPATVTRTWSWTTQTATDSSSVTAQVTGEERLEVPFTFAAGIALFPSKQWAIAVDYAVNNYGSMEYVDAAGAASNPWVDGATFRVGVEFRPAEWIMLRAGWREDPQVQAPAGSGLPSEPARGHVYAGGIGVAFSGLLLDLGYEYGSLETEDAWLSNVNYNTRVSHRLVAELAYRF
jgi:opacity protein-like surface antigen